jgi:hypothetical protein
MVAVSSRSLATQAGTALSSNRLPSGNSSTSLLIGRGFPPGPVE